MKRGSGVSPTSGFAGSEAHAAPALFIHQFLGVQKALLPFSFRAAAMIDFVMAVKTPRDFVLKQPIFLSR